MSSTKFIKKKLTNKNNDWSELAEEMYRRWIVYQRWRQQRTRQTSIDPDDLWLHSAAAAAAAAAAAVVVVVAVAAVAAS